MELAHGLAGFPPQSHDWCQAGCFHLSTLPLRQELLVPDRGWMVAGLRQEERSGKLPSPSLTAGRGLFFSTTNSVRAYSGTCHLPVASSLVWPLSLVYSIPRLCWDLAPHGALGENWEAEQARVCVVPKALMSALLWGACKGGHFSLSLKGCPSLPLPVLALR